MAVLARKVSHMGRSLDELDARESARRAVMSMSEAELEYLREAIRNARKPKYESTKALRSRCAELGIEYTTGYAIGQETVDEDSVTTLWDGTHDGADYALTFEEDEYGYLICADAMDVEQCIGAYLAGRSKGKETK